MNDTYTEEDDDVLIKILRRMSQCANISAMLSFHLALELTVAQISVPDESGDPKKLPNKIPSRFIDGYILHHPIPAEDMKPGNWYIWLGDTIGWLIYTKDEHTTYYCYPGSSLLGVVESENFTKDSPLHSREKASAYQIKEGFLPTPLPIDAQRQDPS